MANGSGTHGKAGRSGSLRPSVWRQGCQRLALSDHAGSIVNQQCSRHRAPQSALARRHGWLHPQLQDPPLVQLRATRSRRSASVGQSLPRPFLGLRRELVHRASLLHNDAPQIG